MRTRKNGFLTYDFNVPKIAHGHNKSLLTLAEDLDVIQGVISTASSLNPRLSLAESRWKILCVELSENRTIPGSRDFTQRVGFAAVQQNKSNVTNYSGYLSTLVGPKCRRTRIYAKCPGVNDEVRHEIVLQKFSLARLVPDRSIVEFQNFMVSEVPVRLLRESWKRYAEPYVRTPNIDETADQIFCLDLKRREAASLVAYHALSLTHGQLQANRLMRLSRTEIWTYSTRIRQAAQHGEGSRFLHGTSR